MPEWDSPQWHTDWCPPQDSTGLSSAAQDTATTAEGERGPWSQTAGDVWSRYS